MRRRKKTKGDGQGSLIKQLGFELLQDSRILSQQERELLQSVLRRGLTPSVGGSALDPAVSQTLVSVTAASIADRVSQVLAQEVVSQLSAFGLVGSGIEPSFGPVSPIRGLIGERRLYRTGEPDGGQVSPSNPGNPGSGQVSPSNPGNPGSGQVSPSNPGNPGGHRIFRPKGGRVPGAGRGKSTATSKRRDRRNKR